MNTKEIKHSHLSKHLPKHLPKIFNITDTKNKLLSNKYYVRIMWILRSLNKKM